MDELARAYAILGISPGVSPTQVKRRYKALVRQWHPDRFGGDARGQAEAAVRMREINDAFRRVAGTFAGVPAAAPGGTQKGPTRRLSREEIERLVSTIGTDGPMDWFLSSFSWTFPSGAGERARRRRFATLLPVSAGLLMGGLALGDARLAASAKVWLSCGTGIALLTFLLMLARRK